MYPHDKLKARTTKLGIKSVNLAQPRYATFFGTERSEVKVTGSKRVNHFSIAALQLY